MTMYGYELDSQGFFICDIPTEAGVAGAQWWTRDPVLQPANRPQYVGGQDVGGTGEQTGGAWVDAEAVSAEEQARQLFNTQQLRLTAVIQRRLDEIAAERGYDSILSLCSYATSSVPRFRAEGQAGVDLRDRCWMIGYQVLADVAQGLRDFPSDDEALAMMPAMDWPE
jgi:hypothetical protein